MEYASGGELFDFIVANMKTSEQSARHFFRQIVSAIDYCHKNSVIHRDLKPEVKKKKMNPSSRIYIFSETHINK